MTEAASPGEKRHFLSLKKEEFKMLHEKLTESDVKKIQEEIEHRKLVIRKEAL